MKTVLDHAPKRKPRRSRRGLARPSQHGAEGAPVLWWRSSEPRAGVLHHALPVQHKFVAALVLFAVASLAGASQADILSQADAAEGATESVALIQPPSPDRASQHDRQEEWEIQSVRELMQQDLREAARASTGEHLPAAETGVRPVLAPRLVAMYGVGRTLMAEVQVGRQAYLYVRGQPYPAGHAGDQGVYQLRGMNGACVQLERGQDRHSLCLRMLLGEVRP